jgi:hypothetical protein
MKQLTLCLAYYTTGSSTLSQMAECPLLRLNNIALYLYHIFTCSSTDRHLDCFHTLVLMNNEHGSADIFTGYLIFFPLDMYSKAGLLDHMVV